LIASATLARNNLNLNPGNFPATSSKGGKVVTFQKKQAIFTQGDAASSVFYIQEGKVSQTAISKFGKEATLAILSKGAFFGDDGLAGQSLRAGSAIAVTNCKLLQIDNEAMLLALHEERAFLDLFVAYLLMRNIQYQEDIVDQLFGPSENRLARVLLLQARFREEIAF
jgi:CRP/FNR family cyclic AMP-dependent transcriptional regulator